MSQKESVELFESIHAGFPSPAEDIPGKSLDIKELLVKNPASTFFAKVQGESMINAGLEMEFLMGTLLSLTNLSKHAMAQ